MPKSVTFGACVATVFASLTIPGMAARADDCLAAPNRTAGPGTHWVPRVDRAANRKCWYLVDAAGRPAPPPEGDSIGTLISKWLTGENNPPDPHANQTDSDALFRQFLRWKERQPADKERRLEQTQQ